jgi:hypothetical protein
MKKLTNRDLVQKIGISLTQAKRWAVLCLGRDPEADQAGGVVREYTHDEAFIIYLFGEVLVGRFRMGLKQAKTHMDNIKPQLVEEKLLPSNLDYELPLNIIKLMPLELLEKYKDIIKQRLFINLIIYGENDYLIEWEVVTSIDDVKIDDKHYAKTYSVRKCFPTQFPMSVRDGQQFVIELDFYLLRFTDLFIKGN